MFHPSTNWKSISDTSNVCDVVIGDEGNGSDVGVIGVVANDEGNGGRDHVSDFETGIFALLLSKGKVLAHGGHCVHYLAGRYIQLRPLLEDYQTSYFSPQCSENIRLSFQVSKVQ